MHNLGSKDRINHRLIRLSVCFIDGFMIFLKNGFVWEPDEFSQNSDTW